MPKRSTTPGLKRLPKPSGCTTWYWSASQIAHETFGFRSKTARLWHGIGYPTEAELDAISRQADRLNGDLREWLLRHRLRMRTVELKRRRRGHIYFVRAGTAIKIGYAGNVERRLAEIQTHCPEPIELIYSMPGSPTIERALHAQFSRLRLRGEWFQNCEQIAAFIREQQARMAPKTNRKQILKKEVSADVRIAGGYSESQKTLEQIQ